jgi:Protein of unknown function (DUF998)
MESVPGWGVVSSLAAPVLLIGGWTVAARLQPGAFDSVTGTISALAADDAGHRWVMTAALAGVGVAHITTALALRPAAPAGRWLIATGGLATVLVAAAPLPSSQGSSTPHSVAAGIAFVSLGVWPAISWRRRTVEQPEPEPEPEPEPAPVPFRPVVAIAASGILLAGLGWFFAELFKDGDRVGLSERVAAGSQALWPFAAVLITRRTSRR